MSNQFSEFVGPPPGAPSADVGGTQRGREHASVYASREGLRDSFDATRVGYDNAATPNPVYQFDFPDPLAAPDPRPGYTQRWVYVGYGGEDATGRRNWSRAVSQEGYQPRLAETVEKTLEFPLRRQQSDPHRQVEEQGYILRAGHILMERPEHITRAREAHFARRAAELVNGLEVNLQKETRGNHGGPGARFVERTVDTTTGRGSNPGSLGRRPPVG